MRFSNSGSTASGVTSRPVNPVPPVVMTTSTAGSAIQRCTCARIASISSRTMRRSATTWPADRMRSTRVAPDLSSFSSRVSETVSTAIFSGTNGFDSSMPGISELRGPEGVAALDRAALEPGVEPAHALLRGAVGERVGHDVAASLLLQPVVADCRRGFQRLVDVARLDQLPALLRAIGPNAGEAIGLQLDAHLQLIGLDLAERMLALLRLRQDAEQVLHVMPDLVGNHVGLRELAGLAVVAAAEPALQVAEERGVEIDAPIVRAIERPHGGARGAAGRAGRAGEHHQGGRLVVPAGLTENVAPFRFGAAQHRGDELAGHFR